MQCRPIYTSSKITTNCTQITSTQATKPQSGLQITRRYYRGIAWLSKRYPKKTINIGDQIVYIEDLRYLRNDHEMSIDDILVVLSEDTIENETTTNDMLENNTNSNSEGV